MAAVGKSKEQADAARCRSHPRHRRSAGVCPFCLRDRLSRLSSVASHSSSSAASSPCSSGGEESVVAWAAQAPPPPHCHEARRARLGTLMRQEGRESTTTGHQEAEEEALPREKTKARRITSSFWARLQQLHHRKDGCSLAHSRADGERSGAAAPKRPPLF